MPDAGHSGLRLDMQTDLQTDLQTDMTRDLTMADGNVLECTLVSRAGPRDWERWASVRGSGLALWGQRPRRGHAKGTRKALVAAHGQTVLCGTPGCSALVDLQAARRVARAAGRHSFEAGDGCANAGCSVHHAPVRFAQRQTQKAAALLARRRVLVLWPPSTSPRVYLWEVPPSYAEAMAHDVLTCVADGPADM